MEPTKTNSVVPFNAIAALMQAHEQTKEVNPFKSEHARKRHETKVVDNYLHILAAGDPRMVQEKLERKLARIEDALKSESDPVKKLFLAQERIEVKKQIRRNTSAKVFDEYEREFIEHALSYSNRKKISYMAWRSVGVSAEVLRKAGIPRNRVD